MASVALAGSGFLEPASRDSQVSHVQPRAVVAQVQNLLQNPYHPALRYLQVCVLYCMSACLVSRRAGAAPAQLSDLSQV